MANKQYKQYLQSKEWVDIRVSLIESRKCCERCGNRKGLQVHHKTYKNIFNEEPSDLELLCSGCHQKEHFKPVKKIKTNYPSGLTLAQKVAHKKKKSFNKKIRKHKLKVKLGIKSKYDNI